MIKFNLYIEKYDWIVRVFLSVHGYHVDEIEEALAICGCSRRERRKAVESIEKGNLNTGLCFSNPGSRMSVLVVSKASRAGEFFNTITHEIAHLATHIAEAQGIDYGSEEFCYLVGDVADCMFPKCKQFLCDCRRRII